MHSDNRPANDEPLFDLDLGANGGRLAPTTMEDLVSWLQKEISAWNWILGQSYGNHDGVLRDSANEESKAVARATEALQHRQSSPEHATQQIRATQELIRHTYVETAFPHTSTPIFRRVATIRSEHGDMAASFYAAASIDRQGTTYEPRQLTAYKALLDAIVDKYGTLGPSKSKVKAVEDSINELRAQLETLIGDKRSVLDELHRDYQKVALNLAGRASQQEGEFTAAQDSREESFAAQKAGLEQHMEGIRRAFREELSLRAPAAYWTSKRTAHRWIAGVTGALSFAAKPGQTPDHWRIVVLALVAVFAVWAVRLVVRIFLSHVHLAGDASERVVMLHTYLTLIEGGQLTEDGERQLILNALFRPGSDGMVKDEGLPPSWMEFFTRNPKP